jgi:hypothetical protein
MSLYGIVTVPFAGVEIASRTYVYGGLRALSVSLDPDSRILRVMKPTETNPVFTSAPVYTDYGTGGDYLVECPTAKDPQGLPVTFSLTKAPANMWLNANSCVEFTPKRNQDNQYFPIEVKATNSAGDFALQDFTIATFVVDHYWSPIAAAFNASAKVGVQWSYDPAFARCANADGSNNLCNVDSVDQDGDTVHYQFSGLPATAYVQNRILYWTPAASDAGKTYSVVFKWSDMMNDTYQSQTTTVTVSP